MLSHHFSSSSNEDFSEDVSFRQRKTGLESVVRPTIEQTDPVDLTGSVFTGAAVNQQGVAVLVYAFQIVGPGLVRVTATNPRSFVGKLDYDILQKKNGLTRRILAGEHNVIKGFAPRPA